MHRNLIQSRQTRRSSIDFFLESKASQETGSNTACLTEAIARGNIVLWNGSRINLVLTSWMPSAWKLEYNGQDGKMNKFEVIWH